MTVAVDVPSVKTHNGILTIVSKRTGEHRTVKISTQSKDSKFAPGKRVVALLSGPDNESDYRSFGFVDEHSGVVLFRKHQDSAFYVWLRRFLNNPVEYVESVDVLFEGRCRVCNRVLTEPESIMSGIGPVCAGRE